MEPPKLNRTPQDREFSWVVVLSPFALIAVCHGVQRVAGLALGVWAWLPAMLTFWALIAGEAK